MSADERNRKLEEAYATLAKMSRSLQHSGRKFASMDDANVRLVEVVGKRAYTQVEIDKRLDDFIKFGLGGDAGQS
jgi:hypothetical protein